MLKRPYLVFRNGLLFDRHVNSVAAKRHVLELQKQGFQASWAYKIAEAK